METASALEKARARYPGAPDAVLIEDLVEQFSRDLGLRTPTNLHVAAHALQIKHIQQGDIEWAGMLTPADDGTFTITVRRSDTPHRKNFTIGHEITHTLLPGYTITQRRCDGRGSGSLGGWLEGLADVGAAELLLPRRYLRPVFRDMTFSLAGLQAVAAQHHASLTATVRQFLHLVDRPGVLLDVRREVSLDGGILTTLHRVYSNSQWCAVAPGQLHGRPVPERHGLCSVFENNELNEVLDFSLLAAATTRAAASALMDSYIDNGGKKVMRALVLATPTENGWAHRMSQHHRLAVAS